MSNCTACGKYAAEGNMICPNCHTKANKAYADLEQDLRAAHEEIGRLRARLYKATEFPCEVGDMAVSIFEYEEKPMIEIGKVKSLSIDEKSIWVNCFYKCGLRYYHKVGDRDDLVFYGKSAKEQAEARLKELKGDK